MKIDSKHILEAFSEIKFLLLGIEEIIASGDDGFEDSVCITVKDINKIMTGFAVDYMTPKEPEVKVSQKFLKKHEQLHDKEQDETITLAERTELFRARYYLYLLKAIRDLTLPFTLDRGELEAFIYDNSVAGSVWEQFYRTDYFRDAHHVLDAVVDEIVAERKKYPQIQLFTEITKPQSRLLIDML